MVGYEIERFADGLEELVFLEHELVGGDDDDVGLWAACLDAVGGVGDAGRGVAPGGLGQDLVVGEEGELLLDEPDVAPIGDDVDVFSGDDFLKAVDGHLQERSPCAEEIEKLFRPVFTAEGPEAATDAAAHDDAIIIVHSKVFYSVQQRKESMRYRLRPRTSAFRPRGDPFRLGAEKYRSKQKNIRLRTYSITSET